MLPKFDMVFFRTFLLLAWGITGSAARLAAQVAAPDVQANMTAQLHYVETYKTLAIAEMQRTGVPASITLAQAILETNGGQSLLAREANNHFGLKCTSQWKGANYYKDDDEFDDEGNPVLSCFRQYPRPQESYADHSRFLKRPRYAFLFRLPGTDYHAWAAGLDTARYSFAEGYGQKLIDIIDRYRLFEYDARRVADFTGDANLAQRRLGWLNGVAVVLADEGETLSGLARIYGLSPDDLVRHNDRGYTATQALPAGAFVFLAEKRDQWGGRFLFHTVLEGETIFSIAQLYGIRLADLRARNDYQPGRQPRPGERLQIREPLPEPPSPLLVVDDAPPAAHELLLTAAEADLFLARDAEPATTIQLSDPEDEFYTVQTGDTLFAIARRFETSVARLKELNQLTGDSVRTGQLLKIQ